MSVKKRGCRSGLQGWMVNGMKIWCRLLAFSKSFKYKKQSDSRLCLHDAELTGATCSQIRRFSALQPSRIRLFGDSGGLDRVGGLDVRYGFRISGWRGGEKKTRR